MAKLKKDGKPPAEFFETKEKIRERARNMSYYEKLQRVVEMQKLEAKLPRNKNKKVYIWNLD